MRTARTTIGILIAATLLASCGPEEDEPIATPAMAGPPALELNDGRKWEMDEHTRASFSKMADSFLRADPSAMTEAGRKQAGQELQEDLKGLIQGCTMTGAAHDQLHAYLAGYIPAVAALAESGRVEDAEEVRRYLETYDDYFE